MGVYVSMKKARALLFSVILLAGCGRSDMKLGTSGQGGVYEAFGNALSEKLAEEDSLQVEVRNTAGSAANIRLLNDSYIQLGIAQADVVSYMYTGSVNDSWSAIASLYTEAVQIIASDASGIKTVADLEGKTVSIGADESGTEENAKEILAACGLNELLVKEKLLDYPDAAKEIRKGTIDALFVTAGAPAHFVEELMAEGGYHFVYLDDATIERLKRTYDYYTDTTIPARTYTGQNDEVQTVGVKSILLASDTLSEETVQQIMDTLFANSAAIYKEAGIGETLSVDSAVLGVSVPFHKGAVSWYEAHGIHVEGKGD